MKLREDKPEIVAAIVGTAGHVHHGKTSLVRLLTGCDTMHLPEEKARKLTIDLGYAPCHLPGHRLVGIVDVPGHEDFIRNMVAGAASIDALMLLIAADDAVMPQTIEHLRIVNLLRTPRLMVVITKIDLVDADTLALVREEVQEFLVRMGFAEAPILTISNETLEGLGEVRQALETLISQIVRKPDPRAFRLNTARIFSAKGFGSVVTGIPISGRVRVGESLERLPGGGTFVTRAIQTYKLDSEEAAANICCAINLRDLPAETVVRGMTVAAPGVYHATRSAIVHLKNTSDSLVLKRNLELKFHAGTAAVDVRVKLLEGTELKPGQETFAQLLLAEPVVLAAGDRYILRALTPSLTLGGGVVLSADDYQATRAARFALDRLAPAFEAVLRLDYFGAELLAGERAILSSDQLAAKTQRERKETPALIQEKEESGELLRLGPDGWLVVARKKELPEYATSRLAHYHKLNPYTFGLDPTQVCGWFGLDATHFEKLAAVLSEDKTIQVKSGKLALTSFSPALNAGQLHLREVLLQKFETCGVNAPAYGNMLAELGAREADLKLVLKLLVAEKRVVAIGKNYLLTEIVNTCREKYLALFETQPIIDLARFREVTGFGRNLAVEVLELFDAQGWTKRVEGGRVLLRKKTATGEKI